MADTLIDIGRLTKTFGSFTAVNEVSFSVARGEVLGFLGPNGAGKSTTMRMLAGFIRPTLGRASICGYDVIDQGVKARACMGYLPEGAPAYPDMIVEDFLAFIGRMRGFSGGELRDRIRQSLRLADLLDVSRLPIETLSKGTRRRVGLAQALLHDPDVLVLDEPTDGLDPNQKHQIRELIRSMAPRKAIIVSTHILEEVDALCTRAIIIAGGRIVADDTPMGLTFRHPSGKLEAAFRMLTTQGDAA